MLLFSYFFASHTFDIYTYTFTSTERRVRGFQLSLHRTMCKIHQEWWSWMKLSRDSLVLSNPGISGWGGKNERENLLDIQADQLQWSRRVLSSKDQDLERSRAQLRVEIKSLNIWTVEQPTRSPRSYSRLILQVYSKHPSWIAMFVGGFYNLKGPTQFPFGEREASPVFVPRGTYWTSGHVDIGPGI